MTTLKGRLAVATVVAAIAMAGMQGVATLSSASGPVATTASRCQTPSITIYQNGTTLYWFVCGITPGGTFTVSENTSQGFVDFFVYAASSLGTEARPFHYGSGTQGDVITLLLTECGTNGPSQAPNDTGFSTISSPTMECDPQATAKASFVVQPETLEISVSQNPGLLPTWHIDNLTPDSLFSVYISGGGLRNTLVYYSNNIGVDTRSFAVGTLPPGTVITLFATDNSTGQHATTAFTLDQV